MPLNIGSWLLAAAPILLILTLMIGANWGGARAGAAAWIMAVVIAVAFFGVNFEVLAYAQAKSVLLSLDVLLIIWAALLLYHVADDAGAVRVIGERLPSLTPDRTMQSLLLSWLFVSFLQGMGGFGVPVAVVAPLLVTMGYAPAQAVLMTSVGHGWSVTFGSFATSFQALVSATGLPPEALAPEPAVMLGIISIPSALMVAYAGGGWRSVWRALPAALVLGAIMGVVQYLMVTNGLWVLGATGASLAGIAGGVVMTRLPMYARPRGQAPGAEDDGAKAEGEPPAGKPRRSLWLALSGYGVLILLAFGINLIPSLDDLFNRVVIRLYFPELVTALGWVTPAGEGRSLSVFGHPGSILFYSAVIAYLIYRRAGYFAPGSVKRIAQKVIKGAINSSLGILAMVGMSAIMTHAGMTSLLARGLSEGFSAGVYPLIAPFLGALGAFMTGSNTNSNVVFGALQQQTAQLLGLSVTLILAAQTSGAALGSVLAPAKIIVGCSTVGLTGQEGSVIGKVLVYGLILVALIALIAWLMYALGG